jgi:hypothetical protein
MRPGTYTLSAYRTRGCLDVLLKVFDRTNDCVAARDWLRRRLK